MGRMRREYSDYKESEGVRWVGLNITSKLTCLGVGEIIDIESDVPIHQSTRPRPPVEPPPCIVSSGHDSFSHIGFYTFHSIKDITCSPPLPPPSTSAHPP